MYNKKYSKILGLDYHNKQSKVMNIIWFYAKYKMKKVKIKFHDLNVWLMINKIKYTCKS